jgi:hypothetical protein
MSRTCEVLRKDKVDVGDESSLEFPSLLLEFTERALPFRLSQLCCKETSHQLDDSGPGSELNTTVVEGEAVYAYRKSTPA